MECSLPRTTACFLNVGGDRCRTVCCPSLWVEIHTLQVTSFVTGWNMETTFRDTPSSHEFGGGHDQEPETSSPAGSCDRELARERALDDIPGL